ncbi:MAG: hypothetical protein GF372_10115 [Candidatus Marinimicrobia bacterium]|nr:hypothetical protein [Candidatus Neomarinimicrobiota bacterium]
MSNIEEAAVFTAPAQNSDTEIVLTREDARIIKGEKIVIHQNKFTIDSVEVEIFTHENSTRYPAKNTNGVTIAELVDALHYLDLNPERIIHFLQNAVNAGLIEGKLLLK